MHLLKQQHHTRLHWRFILITVFCFCLFICIAQITHAASVNTAPSPSTQGGVDVLGGAINGLFSIIADLMYQLSLGIGGVIAGLGGLLLELSFQHTVLNFGNYFSASGVLGTGVIGLWKIFRDTLNILFIFGLIYIGLRTILNSDDSSTRRALGLLIIAALLINFSLYITEVAIDFSNIAAVQVYNQIARQEFASSASQGGVNFVGSLLQVRGDSLTGAFLNITGVSSMLGGLPTDSQGHTADPIQIMVYSIFLMVFLIAAGIVFAMGAFLLIGRFIALIIYMILSPAMFIGFILPSLGKQQQEWRSGFIKQALFAPAFLFMLYMSLIVLVRLKANLGISPDSKFTDLATPTGIASGGVFTMFFFFVVMLGLLYASIKVAQKMGGAAASTSLKAFDSVTKGARSALYRNTVGAGIEKYGVGGINALDRHAENEKANPFSRSLARITRTAIGGEERRQQLEKAANYGAGGLGREAQGKLDKTRSQRATRANEVNTIKQVLSGATSTPAQKERAIADATNAQLTQMLKSDSGKKLILENAGKLSTSQYEAIDKSEDINDEFRTSLGTRRGEQVAARLTANPSDPDNPKKIEDVIGKADIADLKAMGYKRAFENAQVLSTKQISDWKELTTSEKDALKAERKEKLLKEFADGAGAKIIFDRFNKDDERSKLPDDILTHPASAPYLSVNVLSKILDNDGIANTELKKIKKTVMDHYQVFDPNGKFKTYDTWFKTPMGLRYPD